MKKLKALLVILSMLILVVTLNVYAATPTAKLAVSSNEVKQGDTFTVTLNVSCEDGINGVMDIQCNYDEDNLELVDSGVKDSRFITLGSDIICNSEEKVTSSDIYVFNFKVKDAATVNKEINISLDKISIDSDASENSTSEIDVTPTKIKVIDKDSYEEQKDENETSNENTTNTTNTTKTDNKINTANLTNKTNSTDTINTSEKLAAANNINQSGIPTTLSNNNLPKTGTTFGIVFILIGIIIITVFLYTKLIKYKDLK